MIFYVVFVLTVLSGLGLIGYTIREIAESKKSDLLTAVEFHDYILMYMYRSAIHAAVAFAVNIFVLVVYGWWKSEVFVVYLIMGLVYGIALAAFYSIGVRVGIRQCFPQAKEQAAYEQVETSKYYVYLLGMVRGFLLALIVFAVFIIM